jgi:voltage-gated potassium channel
MGLERRLLTIVFIFGAIIAFGGVGYVLIEGWPWVDAFYMAIITITTVGFAEVYPLSAAGRVFTSVLIILGVASITYTFTALANYLIAGELGDVLEEFRVNRQIGSLQDHYIVCGFGRVGHQVCTTLRQENQPLVVVDTDGSAIERARAQGFYAMKGDAGDDEVLEKAGITRAQGLVAAVESDVANLYVVLTSRTLNPDLFIVARADTEDTEDKLQRAGADRVLSPYSLGGRLIAQTLIHRDVVDFLEAVMYDESLHLFLEDLTVGAGSPLEASTVGEARIRERTGANILGLKRGEDVIVSPDAETMLQAGDVLVALGTRQQLEELARVVQSPAVV